VVLFLLVALFRYDMVDSFICCRDFKMTYSILKSLHILYPSLIRHPLVIEDCIIGEKNSEEACPMTIHVKTRVQAGGRIEIIAPELQEGQEAEITITLPTEETSKMYHVLDIISTVPPHRHFQTSEEVDTHICEERDAWEQ
jgi:hypothetical protein